MLSVEIFEARSTFLEARKKMGVIFAPEVASAFLAEVQ